MTAYEKKDYLPIKELCDKRNVRFVDISNNDK